jgi:uncharacterized protein
VADAAALDEVLDAGYGFDDDAVILGRPLDPDLVATRNAHYVQVPLRLLNRHGLIAGATGTGKTKTLQLFAEQLSRAGIPVFLADLKGDLSGLSAPSPGASFIDERMTSMDLPWQPESFPVEFLSITGEVGTPLRVPLSSFGPLLLAKVMDCTDVQESVLQIVFKYADEAQLALLDLVDLIELLKFLTSDEGKEVQKDYGGMSSQTIGVLLRKAMELETQGAEQFFGEPEFDVADLRRTVDGKGVITVMNLVDVQTRPRIFSTFMMWLLAEIHETSPEVGDQDRPELVFFFDEAHLLFDGASKTLRDSVELTVRMIRSKGVGVYFVTQQPTDLPDGVLAQLGNRVQHALRAFTPQDQKALRSTAATFPISEHYDVREALTGLGTGEALVTVLGPNGAPTPTAPTRLVAPVSQMEPADPAAVRALIEGSPLRARYAEVIDRDSAAEILARRAEERAAAAAAHERAAEEAEVLAERERELASAQAATRTSKPAGKRSSRASATERLVKNAASSVGREVGRSLVRGILGNLGR